MSTTSKARRSRPGPAAKKKTVTKVTCPVDGCTRRLSLQHHLIKQDRLVGLCDCERMPGTAVYETNVLEQETTNVSTE